MTNANGSNAADPGDPGLAGWVVKAYADDGDGTLDATEAGAAAVDSDTTGAGGAYTLTLDPGDYVVCEELQASWFQSAPAGSRCDLVVGAGDGGHAVTVTSGSSATGKDFGNYQQGTVTGLKFRDDDANGSNAADPGDPGLAGWVVKAYADDGDGTLDATEAGAAAVDSDTTGAGGAYTLTLDPGDYVVCEELQASWFQSAPAGSRCDLVVGAGDGGHAVTVTSGSSATGKDFGNYQQGTVTGLKFRDDNANGSNAADPGDPGLAGWVVKAYADDGDGTLDATEAGAAAVDSDTTGAGGAYTLTLDPGDYVVCEELQASWFQSAPAGSRCDLVVGAGDGGHAVTVTSGSSATGKDFGNYQQGTVSGLKFRDDDANGSNAADPGDPGLAGWVVKAYADDGDGTLDATEAGAAAVDSDTTGAGGAYTLTLDPGDYVVCEELQASWFQSAPAGSRCDLVVGAGDGGHAVTVTSGSSATGKDFGNYQQGTVTGLKFRDDDANGSNAADPGDPGLAGWVVKAYADDGDGTLDATEAGAAAVDSDTTGAGGAYTLTLDPGDYVVCEELQASWFQSAPAGSRCDLVVGAGDGGHAVTVTSGSSATGKDFGNYQQGTVTGLKFRDDDANGSNAADPGDPGLAGWVVKAYADDGDGTLDATEAGAAAVDSDTTGAGGAYTLTLDPGDYVVCEELQASWFQSAPAGSRCDLVVGAGDGGHAVTVTSGSSATGKDFGNYQQGTVTGAEV